MCLVYAFFRLPEPRGRTFAELDVLFERKVNARKFEKTKIDVFQEDVSGEGVISDFHGRMAKAESTEKRGSA